VSKGTLSISALIVLFVCHFGLTGRAVVFDWDAGYATWSGAGNDPGTQQSATRNYDNDSSNPGNDVSITVANTNANGSGFSWLGGVFVDDSPIVGGSGGQDALQFQIQSNNATGIRTTINFNYTGGVRNVSFTLWDVDASNPQFIDIISGITAQTVGGATIGPSSVTTSSANSQSGSGTGIVVTGNTVAPDSGSNGNVTITFNSAQALSSVTFTWRNGASGQGQQAIALHDINYTPALPEVGTSLAALGACLGVGFLRRRRKPPA